MPTEARQGTFPDRFRGRVVLSCDVRSPRRIPTASAVVHIRFTHDGRIPRLVKVSHGCRQRRRDKGSGRKSLNL